jgi:SAM-dependent methyltransferase
LVQQREAAAVKQLVRAQFAASATDYVRSRTHASGPDLVRMLEAAAPAAEELLLDVATGGGHVARVFGPLVKHVVLADLTPTMLAEAGRFLRSSGLESLDSVVADAEALPFANVTFDLVTCRIAPHHFPHPDRFVGEVARVLRPAGRFALIDSTVPEGSLGDFFNRFEKMRDPSHVRSLTVQEWTNLIQDAGLDLRACEPFPKRHDFDDWTSRSRASSQVRVELETMMHTIGDAATVEFGAQWVGDRLVTFTDVKTLFLATKLA